MSRTTEQQKVVQQNSRTGRLVRFLFCPARLGPVPPGWVGSTVLCAPPTASRDLSGAHGVTRPTYAPLLNRFAGRLAKSPPDLVTHLGMVRANAYYATGCPLELCDHAAARDLWGVIYQDAVGMEGLCR